MTIATQSPSVVVFSGGVGGARFAHGVSRALPPESLTIIVNTGDDFEHWGLSISPDIDTVMYTLADLGDEARGWGLAGETFRALEAVKRYGGDDWFSLGDADLATHLMRTQALRSGQSLSEVTERLCRANGILARVVPMSEGRCRTLVDTVAHGTLPFQQWFVKHRAPAVRGVRFEGDPPAAPAALEAIARADVVLFGPSNPYVSIDPILTRPGMREALAGKVVVGVSPIVHGLAVKGPLAEMIPALAQRAADPAAIAQHYEGLLSGLVVERGDETTLHGLPIAGRRLDVLATETVMKSRADSLRLAREVLDFASGLRR